ncbi:exodeoxyribonuclease V subunit alpha [Lysobacter sp. CFH 32150]|uniref:exodeoxyribonuclease V subunit alpha n=1 Tax=Lysobacter sp. CFH 32150 TaxID=2927128 RepID=UPI001FA79678|nr:exodeoxyribonuclease V subunit alpha [Lysobacter sp. CFH 32150]MCI4568051.1 exodeoxyribonuclease V subunit alpha [Lysobacter sp. CFH 32150]
MSRPLRWRDGDGVRAVDLALADVLRRRDRADGVEPDERVLQAAALASLAIAQGHAAFDPARPELLLDDAGELPDARAWLQALAASRWVTTPGGDAVADSGAPLVLEAGLLYLRRYREYERRLAHGLQRLAAHPSDADVIDAEAIAALFAALFPHARDGDRQARAAAFALVQRLLLITGGPGTGKTTTIARLLLLLLAQAQHAGSAPPRIALAAPTGRAAERMAQSLRNAGTQLRATGIDAVLCDALPTAASTLHRLLGTIVDSPRFRHDIDHPLPYDVIVVDEASMVDLPLMCKLVEAVPVGAHLILLGDRDQLPSVEAGDVLAAIVDAAGDDDALPVASAHALQPLLGIVPATSGTTHGLTGHRVQLKRGYRLSDALDLAPLATAMRDGDADRALAVLRDDALRGVHFHDGLLDPLAGATRDALLAPWRALADMADPAQALSLANRMRLLTALREGPQGAHALNARIEEALAGAQRAPYFHGRLLLITENSYRHGLFNGDIGICLRDDEGATVAWFAGSDGPRAFHPAALPAHTGAFAMTVHKAQGSEFDEVWLQLPRLDARPLSRELLYTAITRARSALHVCASEGVLRAALARHAVRISGLAARLAR